MISRELLHAILMGLPHKYFNILEWPWQPLAAQIHAQRRAGADPVTALRNAYYALRPATRTRMRQALQHILPVMQLPGLTYRQRETLIVLRSLNCASLTQICAALTHDRRNTHRRLSALAAKGLAIRIHQPGGLHYMAVENPLDRQTKQAINAFLQALIEEAASPQPPEEEPLPSQADRPSQPAPPAQPSAAEPWPNLGSPAPSQATQATQPTQTPATTPPPQPTRRRRHTSFNWN